MFPRSFFKLKNGNVYTVDKAELGVYYLECESIGYHEKNLSSNNPDLANALVEPAKWMFTENETNFYLLHKTKNESDWTKDAFNEVSPFLLRISTD